MADVTLTYKGDTIGELSASGSKTLETAGKYCEADILLAYVKPQSGGAVLLADETLTEDTFTFEIPFTEAMREYDLYKIIATGSLTGGNFLYFSVNTAQRVRYWNSTSRGFVAFVEDLLLMGTSYAVSFSGQIEKVIAEPYSNTGVIKSGFNIKIWGYKN